MRSWGFITLGEPAPQGSHRGFVNPKTSRVIITEDSKRTRPWRQDIMESVAYLGKPVLDGAIAVRIVFTLPKPKSAKKSAFAPIGKPDLDKLIRAVGDACTTIGLWKDDSRVVEFTRASKVWPGHDSEALVVPGVIMAAVEVTDLNYRQELRRHFTELLAAHHSDQQRMDPLWASPE